MTRVSSPANASRLALAATVALLFAVVAHPRDAWAQPSTELKVERAKVERARSSPQLQPRRLRYRYRYYRRLRPDTARRALGGDGLRPQVSPRLVPGL